MSRLKEELSSFPSTASTSQEVHESNSESASSRKLRVTLLSSEWRSTKGGLSTINRELAVQLAKHPSVEVSVYLPQCSEEDKRVAASHNVQLIEAEEMPGYDPVDWLSFLPENHSVDCVIGHGAVLGRQVQGIRRQCKCKWIQVVHTAPEELGMYKFYADAISKGEKKHQAEVKLCEKADQVVAVGPKLAEAFSGYLRTCGKDQDVLNLTPGIFSEFSHVTQATEERKTFSVLVFGRGDNEDFKLKGYDIAARAIAELKDEPRPYKLLFVGAPSGEEEKVKDLLLKQGIDGSQLTVRCFDERREHLARLFCEVDLAIMPSRTEGFGLAALEALSAGLPVLVSGNSGLGEALQEVPIGSNCVVESEDPKDWANAIKAVRKKKRELRLIEAKLLQGEYAKMFSWQDHCNRLVERMLAISQGFNADEQNSSKKVAVICQDENPSPSEKRLHKGSKKGKRPLSPSSNPASKVPKCLGDEAENLDIQIDCNAIEQGGASSTQNVSGKENVVDRRGPSSQEVLNLIADKFIQKIDPSDEEGFNGFLQYMEKMRQVIVVDVKTGSLIITVRCTSLRILDELWKDYCTGHLQAVAQRYLVTEDILQQWGLDSVQLTLTISEEEYKAYRENFLKNEGIVEPVENTSLPDDPLSVSDLDTIKTEGEQTLPTDAEPSEFSQDLSPPCKVSTSQEGQGNSSSSPSSKELRAVSLKERLKNLNEQILETEKKIRDKLESLTDPAEEENQEKEKIRKDLEEIKSELGGMGEKLITLANEDREKCEKIEGEITATGEKLDVLTLAGQESNDKGTSKSKVLQGASSDPAGARSEALGSSKRVLLDQDHGEASIASGTVRRCFAAGPSDLNMKQTYHDQGGFYPTGLVDFIRQLYRTRERWFAPFPWWEKFLLSLDNNFTRLKIVRRKKETGTKPDETVTMKDIFKPHGDCAHPRTVLIEGRPGIGKTMFCNKLAYDWAANPSGSFFPNFQVVLLLKCREIESCLSGATEGQPLPPSKKGKLNKIFKSVLWDAIDDQLLPRDYTKEDKEELFKFVRYNQPDILLVLDGLNELPTNMFAAFKEVIQGRMLPKCHIVATARQEVGMEVRECCDTLLEIEGSTKEDAREFIFRYFKTAPHLAQKLLNKLESNENLQQLTESPLNTVLLCLFCEDSDGIFPESCTQLYLEMVECVLRRYREKKGLPLPNTKDEDLTKVYKTQLRQLGSIAWNGLLHNTMSLEEGEFKNCSEELPEFGFLSVECSLKKGRPSLNYSFQHKTFQELFAAFYLCCLVLDNEICPETLIANNRYFNDLKQVLLFTCGVLASQSKEAIYAFVSCIAKQVNDDVTFSVALECVKECKNEQTLHLLLARTLGSHLQITQLNLSDSCLGPGDCTALAEAIKHNSTITQLDLSGNGLGTGDCTVLAEAIKHNSTITQLDLSWNGLGTGDCTVLAEAIKHNSTITQLNLSWNGLGTGDCTALAEAIKHNSTITQLDLSENLPGAGDCTALAEAIKHNSTITQLDLSYNKLGTGDGTALAEAIKHNSTITQLNL